MASEKTDPTRVIAEAMTVAAHGLLGGLDPDQRSAATWPFPADDERRLWFYTPTDHGGLALSDMDSAQHRLVYRLVATGLSGPGFATASAVIGLENVLDHVEGFAIDFGRPRGRDPLMYWIAIFGAPGSDAWSWRFGGHHVSLHFTIVDGQVRSATPCFFGADPANTPLLGPHMHRPLSGVEDLGRELVRMLDDSQLPQARASTVAPVDLITSNRTVVSEGDVDLPLPAVWRGRFEEQLDSLLSTMQTRAEALLGVDDTSRAALAFSRKPKGIAATAMTQAQHEVLRALLGTYVGRIHDDLADIEAQKYAGAGIDDLHFLWAGSLEPGEPHYYRIQGPTLLAEYDNTQRDANHIHSVWRDLTNDFGGDPLATHIAHEH